MTAEFPKTFRVQKKRDFQKIFYSKQYLKGECLKLSFVLNEKKKARLGLSISSRFGIAPKRNRFKRIIREIFRKNLSLFPENLDLNISPTRTLEDFSYSLLEKDFLSLIAKLKN